MENYTAEEQFKKEEIYLDLSKCTEDERKKVEKITGIIIYRDHFYIHFHSVEKKWLAFTYFKNQERKQELTYPKFIKLFEGGESKEDFAIYKRTFNNIPYPRVEWECNCGFKHCLNEGFEQDYRKDNFKEIRLPIGNCLKCKKEIKTHSLESKEVLQVENSIESLRKEFQDLARLKGGSFLMESSNQNYINFLENKIIKSNNQ